MVAAGGLLVSGWLGGGEAASWAIAGHVRDVMRCGAMQSTTTGELAGGRRGSATGRPLEEGAPGRALSAPVMSESGVS